MGIGKKAAQPLLDAIGKRISKPLGIYVEEAIPKMDLSTLVRLSKEEPPKFDTWLKRTNDYVNGEQGGGLEAANLVDKARAAHQEIDLKSQVLAQKHHDPLAPPEQPVLNTTTGINKADKKWADEWVASEKGQEYIQKQKTRKESRLADQERYDARNELPYQRTSAKLGEPINPDAYKHRGRYDQATSTARREINDATTTAEPSTISEFFEEPIQAQTGYKTKAGVKNPDRDPALGFKPTNKDMETGTTYTDLLSQHHILFNDDIAALADQKVFKDDPGFFVATQRYIAQKYDSAFGEAAKNMANLPQEQVHMPYHTWLRKLKIDGLTGSNYEQFWKWKLKENPNMTAQQIQDAIDQWFDEIIYPSIIMLDDWLAKADPKTFSKKEVSFPRELLKQARASIKNEMNTIKPTAKPGTTAYDVQLDDIHTRAERGEFGPGQRSWFTDSKARKDAMNVIQSQE